MKKLIALSIISCSLLGCDEYLGNKTADGFISTKHWTSEGANLYGKMGEMERHSDIGMRWNVGSIVAEPCSCKIETER